MLDAQQVANKWAQAAAAAGPAMKAGLMAMDPSENPMAKAAAAEAKWVQGVQAAAANHSFSRGCNAVSMDDWRNAMLTKGIANYQNGIRGGQGKMMAFMQAFLPFVQGKVRSLPPRGTLRDNINRATQMMTDLAQFQWGKGGRLGGAFGPGI